MNAKSILVQCDRPDLGTGYAYLDAGIEALTITYVAVFDSMVYPRHVEHLPYSLYPEARDVHDGIGWNAGEIASWVQFAEGDDPHAE